VAQGDRVVVVLPRIPEWQIAMVAILKLGAVAVPCVTMLTARDLGYRVADCGATAVITTAGEVTKFDGLPERMIRVSIGAAIGWDSLDDLLAEGSNADFTPATVAAEDPALIFYTSGSTGHPKGVTHAARALFAWRGSAETWLDLSRDDLMFCTADTGWSKAGTSILFGPWSMGSTVLFHDGPFDAMRRIDLIERYGVTVFCAAATELRHLVALELGARDLRRLRLTVSAGESVNPSILARWQASTGTPVLEAYGLTETLMLVANYRDTDVRPGSMGRPLPGLEVALITEDGRHAEPGEIAEIALRLPSPQMMLGYWNDPARTEATLREVGEKSYFMTSDTAHRDARGYLYYHGRSDDVINSAGYRIGPQEVENALIEHAAVKEVAAVPSPDEERGEVVKAFIVLHDGYTGDSALVAELQAHAKRSTAPYKYPRRIAFVTDLPRSAVGKVQRRELRRQERDTWMRARGAVDQPG
jgi:acetyl-CoA synthetase